MINNKSNWYIKRQITVRNEDFGPTLKSFYEVRKDKEPKEVEVGNIVIILNDDDYEEALIGIVDHIKVYEDGLYKIAVKILNYDCFFLTTPDRVGIICERGER